jgi:hypothetical protein
MTNPRTWSEAELRAALDVYEAELRAAGKARNTVNTYVQHPERFINWLVGSYTPAPASRPHVPRAEPGRPRSTYDRLRLYLAERHEPVIALTFSQIESILGRPLPPSARRHRPWWANETSGTHTHARSWLEAGRRTRNADLNAGTVEFVR